MVEIQQLIVEPFEPLCFFPEAPSYYHAVLFLPGGQIRVSYKGGIFDVSKYNLRSGDTIAAKIYITQWFGFVEQEKYVIRNRHPLFAQHSDPRCRIALYNANNLDLIILALPL